MKEKKEVTMTIDWLVEETRRVNKVNGWLDHPQPSKSELLFLIVSECVEANEWLRKIDLDPVSDHVSPFSGEVEELADIFIRAADYVSRYDIPIKEAIRAKLKFNLSRGYRHGKKI